MSNNYIRKVLPVLPLLLLLALAPVAGCGPDGMKDPEDDPVEEQDSTGPGSGVSDEEPGETAENENGEPADQPAGGSVLEYFGKTMLEITGELGEPSEVDFHDGSQYYFYEKLHLAVFFWAESPGDSEVVRAVSLLKDWSVAGVSEGMTFAEIKDLLGEPFYEEKEEGFMLVMDYGQFRLFFSAESETGPAVTVLIKYLDDC